MTDDSEARLQMRVPADLLEAFDRTVTAHDLTRSQAIRHLMRQYVRDHGQTDWVTDGKPKGRGKK